MLGRPACFRWATSQLSRQLDSLRLAPRQELLAQRLVAARAEKLDETTTATGCALLALHGVQAQKWDEARRLVYQGANL